MELRADRRDLSGGELLLDEGATRLYALPAAEAAPLMGRSRHYLQLFAWDRERSEIIGGCRLGVISDLLHCHGYFSLAFSSVFKVEQRLLSRMEQAIDIDEIFVVSDHPRSDEAEAILWRGIGAIIDRQPHVRLLASTIDVSSPYSEPSQRLVAGFLLSGHRRSPWAEQASAVLPVPWSRAPRDARRLDEILLATDGRRAPRRLYRHLEIGMRGLACGLDPEERGCVSILCLADLRCAPIALLERLLGIGCARRFVVRHAGSRLQERTA